MIEFKTCRYCREEYVGEHYYCMPAYLGPDLSSGRLKELAFFGQRLEGLRKRVGENISDESYCTVSFGELRLLFFQLDMARGGK